MSKFEKQMGSIGFSVERENWWDEGKGTTVYDCSGGKVYQYIGWDDARLEEIFLLFVASLIAVAPPLATQKGKT